MQNGFHFVITVEPSITLGRFFICKSAIRNFCWGAILTGIAEESATNTMKESLYENSRRILDRAFEDYNLASNGQYYCEIHSNAAFLLSNHRYR
jgi:hypothetical protein